MFAAIVVALLSVILGPTTHHHVNHAVVSPVAVHQVAANHHHHRHHHRRHVHRVATVNPATVKYHRCTVEDSPGPCFWDGGQNDKGRHFIVTSHQRVIFVKATGKWTEALTVSNAIRNDLGITGEAVLLVGPDQSVVVTATGHQYES